MHYRDDKLPREVYSCEYLADELNITEKEVYMAVGWLAREGKIVFDETGDTVSLPVCPYF